jgi:hypothetical protein
MGDWVGGDKVGGDKVGGDKIEGDKVGGDKVGGDRIARNERDDDDGRGGRRDTSRGRGVPEESEGLDIFISHSSKDADLAEAIINLLRNALNIPDWKIRCTSVDGYRHPIGTPTDERLRLEVREARVFIGLITSASIQSAYVMFELGARWGAHLHLAPLLASSADTALLRGPLAATNALSCDSPAQVHQLVADVASSLGARAGSPATYQKAVEALVSLSSSRAAPTDATA